MIKALVNQVRRNFNDDGRNDRTFEYQEECLKMSVNKLMEAARNLTRAAQGLADALINKPGKLH